MRKSQNHHIKPGKKMILTLKFKLKISPREMLLLINEVLATVDGIDFQGNEAHGTAGGRGVAGFYDATSCPEGTNLVLTITKKPFYLTKGRLKREIEDALEEYKA